MRNRGIYVSIPVISIFGIALMFIFFSMMGARSVEVSKTVHNLKFDSSADDSLALAEKSLVHYINEDNAKIIRQIKDEVDKSLGEEKEKTSEEKLSRMYTDAYVIKLYSIYGENMKNTVKEMNKAMPPLDRGSVYVDNDATPRLSVSVDKETGLIRECSLEGIGLEYMYRGNVIKKITTSCKIDVQLD